MTGSPGASWTFHKFGVFVTGHCEEKFLPDFLRPLSSTGKCAFVIERRVPQLSPVTSKKKLKMVGSGKEIFTRDQDKIGVPARNYLRRNPHSFVLLVDDLEHERREKHQETFERYRNAFDSVLPKTLRHRASVHFLVNMLEAYYFADAAAINAILGTQLEDYDGDVEAIRHPKNDLKEACPGFDELEDGHRIVKQLDLEKVLGNPETCASVRTLFKWCWCAVREDLTERFQLSAGVCSPVTAHQINDLCQGDQP